MGTEELTSLKPGSRKAIIHDIGDDTRIPVAAQYTIMDLSPEHEKIDVFIVKSPSSTNKVVTVFEPATGKNYPNIIKDLPIYNVEEYTSIEQIPEDGHPVLVITPKGATVVVKKCAESTTSMPTTAVTSMPPTVTTYMPVTTESTTPVTSMPPTGTPITSMPPTGTSVTSMPPTGTPITSMPPTGTMTTFVPTTSSSATETTIIVCPSY